MRVLIALLVMFMLALGTTNVFACSTCPAHTKKAVEKCGCGFDKGSEDCIAACGEGKAEKDDDDSDSDDSEDSDSDSDDSEDEKAGENHEHEGHEHE